MRCRAQIECDAHLVCRKAVLTERSSSLVKPNIAAVCLRVIEEVTQAMLAATMPSCAARQWQAQKCIAYSQVSELRNFKKNSGFKTSPMVPMGKHDEVGDDIKHLKGLQVEVSQVESLQVESLCN